MPEPKKTPPSYEGPFDSQEDEDLAFSRSEAIRARRRAVEEAEEADRQKVRKEKKGNLLPVVE
jgi:hypothetical protein